jgi:hypothetical protein
MIDMQKLDASRIETPTMPPIYVVHAMRWGDCEKHSYIVTATLNKADALSVAEKEELERGGKYGCEISCFNCGEKTIIRKPYNGRETFLTEKS